MRNESGSGRPGRPVRPARGVRTSLLALGFLLLGLVAGGQLPAVSAAPDAPDSRASSGEAVTDVANGAAPKCERFVRTELFFGSARPDGTEVSPEQFRAFLDTQITPRFPDGLTVLTGFGQFRGENGEIARERSEVVVLLYPKQSARDANVSIEEIRDQYNKQFDQESVLRADDRAPSCVSF